MKRVSYSKKSKKSVRRSSIKKRKPGPVGSIVKKLPFIGKPIAKLLPRILGGSK